jgi:hypothetical protein
MLGTSRIEAGMEETLRARFTVMTSCRISHDENRNRFLCQPLH